MSKITEESFDARQEGDFENDVFHPFGEGVDEYHLEIFNKWGILLFESNDFMIGWDGYYKSQLVEEGFR